MEAAYRVLVGGEERFGFTDSVDVDQDTCTIPLIGEPDMQLALNRYTPITPLGHCCHDPLIADGFLAAALLHTGHRAWSHDEYQSVEAVELDPDGPIEGEDRKSVV